MGHGCHTCGCPNGCECNDPEVISFKKSYDAAFGACERLGMIAKDSYYETNLGRYTPWPKDYVGMVREFHEKFGVKSDPYLANDALLGLRYDLIEEELSELHEALWEPRYPAEQKTEVADALGDLIYVVVGAAIAWGIDLDRVVAEIHRSNMTKSLDSRRADGKILKGEDYSPPDLSFVLEDNE